MNALTHPVCWVYGHEYTKPGFNRDTWPYCTRCGKDYPGRYDRYPLGPVNTLICRFVGHDWRRSTGLPPHGRSAFCRRCQKLGTSSEVIE